MHLPDDAQNQTWLMQHTVRDFLQITYQGTKATHGEDRDMMNFLGFHW